MVDVCEACESVPFEVEEPCDEGRPYRICAECHRRLTSLTLRPLEWFNLAKTHGYWQFLLHDDFYDEDGTAYQPKGDVDDADRYPAPTLSEVQGDPDRLLDFTITRWHFRQEVAAAWQAIDKSLVLETVTRRYAESGNVDIQAAMLDVAASALAEDGHTFVSGAWSDYREPRQLGSLAKASAACLPFSDGFSRVVDSLAAMDEKQRRDCMYALSYFHRSDTLDWLEQNVSSPVTGGWGRLAAASEFSWDRAVAWLASGRLVSLVALDALAEIVRPQSPLLRDFAPELINKPDFHTFQTKLNQYVSRDAAPRVKKTVGFLIEHAETLTVSFRP